LGAQAAALLDAGGPVGDVPPPAAPRGSLRLTGPEPYDLERVARSHGGVGLAPTAWDGERLHLHRVVVHRDLSVTWSGAAPDVGSLRWVLALDDDLSELWDACDRVPSLHWVRPLGAGRLLRAATAWEDLVGALASTNASYAATRRMLRSLVGDGAFPTAAEVLERDLSGWGYRSASLQRLAHLVADGRVDPQAWCDPAVPDAQVLAELRALPGIGPFAAAQLLPLLGPRPRPVVLDTWLHSQVHPEDYAAMGPWAGSGMLLAVTAHRGRDLP
jgi:PPE-repeat protein